MRLPREHYLSNSIAFGGIVKQANQMLMFLSFGGSIAKVRPGVTM
jgi:hypothetical protein